MAKDTKGYFVGDLEILLPSIDPTLTPSNELDLDDSNTYRWDGASLKTQIGDVMPIVYGRHIIAPTLLNGFIEEGEHETINLLLAWCEGEIESITNLKINGTPINELYSVNPVDPYAESAEFSVRIGTDDQPIIEHFNELHNITAISQVLTRDNPVEFYGTINNTQALRLEFDIDKLYEVIPETDNLTSSYFGIRIEIRASGEQQWRFLGIVEVNKKTTANFKRYFKTEYQVEGKYDLRITKVSNDANNVNTFGIITLTSISEITNEGQNFANTALAGLRLIAFENLEGSVENLKITGIVTGTKVRIPKVTYTNGGDDLVPWEKYYWDAGDSKYRLLGSNTPLFWDGSSYVQAWSANPVWCLRDLLLNVRYGLGDRIIESMINDSSFLTASQYCDEGINNLDGNKEKRFRLDLVIDKQGNAPDVLGVILKTFRGILYSSENTLRLKIEKQEDPVAIFNMGNILSESFSLQYLPKKAPNVISISFINENKEYIRDNLEIYDPEAVANNENPRIQNTTLFGVTRAGQAIREGIILLNKIKNNNTVINFSAYMDSVLLQPYDVIEFQHDVPGWGSGGRVQNGSSTTAVILDKEILLEPTKTYKLKVRNPLTDAIEERDVTNISGVYTTINVSVAFSFTPRKNDIWLLSCVNQPDTKLYRITRIAKQESGEVSITAIGHDNDIYDPTGIVEPKDTYTHLNLDIPKVQNLTLHEIFNKLPNGAIENKIEVSFKIPPTTSKFLKKAKSYEIWMSESGGASWNHVGTTVKEFYVIPHPVSANIIYTVAVVSVGESGEKNPIGQSPQQTISVQGYKIPPSRVENFRYTFTDEIELIWDQNPESDVVGYEIRTADGGWLSESEGLIWRGNATKFVIVRPLARSGIVFYIRAFNSSDVVSTQTNQVEPTNPAPPAPILSITGLFQKAFLRWSAPSDADIVGYEVWRNDQDNFSGVNGQQEEEIVHTGFTTSAVVDLPYATNYFRVVALDRFGRGVFSNVVFTVQNQVSFGEIAPNAITETEIADNSISSPKIRAGAIISDHLTARSILAEHIDVGQLSAISADLGVMRAGQIIGATFKTSEDPFRIELDSIGFRAYDQNGIQTIKMEQGTLCLIDPTCSECYSFLDSGGLVFHTPYGDSPYATKLCSGIATSGQTVKLEQWKGCPQLVLGIKRLKSYDATRSESSQEWCVYADNVRSYDFGGANFGWCFDVRAKLVITGGTRPEEIFNYCFDVIRCTASQTCEALISSTFQIWCHQSAPDPICYGCLCYAIAYRPVGSGVFSYQCFEYLQPHNTKNEIQSSQTVCHSVNFGSNNTWEVKLIELGRHYVQSPFNSGGYVCIICNIQYCCDCSFITVWTDSGSDVVCASAIASGVFTSCNCCIRRNVVLPYSINPGTVVCTRIAYNAVLRALARIGYPTNSATANACAEYGGSVSKSGQYPPTSQWQNTVSVSGCMRTFTGFKNTFEVMASARVSTGFINAFDCAVASVSVQATASYWYKCCLFCCYYCQVPCCVFIGNPTACNTRMFRSMRDITGNEIVLDPVGEISYLAVAYR